MRLFTCHTCMIGVISRKDPSQWFTVRCPSCGSGMFVYPGDPPASAGGKWRGYDIVDEPIKACSPVKSFSPSPILVESEEKLHDDVDIAAIWTPGVGLSARGNAISHWTKHPTVNGKTHESVESYVAAALDFWKTYKPSQVPQLKNPKVYYIHNCTAHSTSASLLIINDMMGKRIASFYDMTPGRGGKTLQQQIVALTGVDGSILFG